MPAHQVLKLVAAPRVSLSRPGRCAREPPRELSSELHRTAGAPHRLCMAFASSQARARRSAVCPALPTLRSPRHSPGNGVRRSAGLCRRARKRRASPSGASVSIWCEHLHLARASPSGAASGEHLHLASLLSASPSGSCDQHRMTGHGHGHVPLLRLSAPPLATASPRSHPAPPDDAALAIEPRGERSPSTREHREHGPRRRDILRTRHPRSCELARAQRCSTSWVLS